MRGSQTTADFVVQFGAVKSSGLLTEPDTGIKAGVTYSVEGIGAGGTRGEIEPTADVFSSLGIISRPLPPSTSRGKTTLTEVLCVRTGDGLIPVSTRDLRLRMGGDGPAEGTIALVGYGGGFHSLSPADSTDLNNGTIHVIYCPYDFSNGVAQKAHAIVLDPTTGNENISIVHADGQAILLQSNGTIRMQSPDGQSFVQVENGKVTLSADQIALKGTVFVGGVETSVPLLAGAASQPCARLFISTP